ncbi:hypothetical protein [Psychrobacillus vulpis]|uniref:Uncharacterized protein n=1 Tax=Psychrobacillus vulpis TaxID=2325572 RepID=A0A544TW56_9BACI|nr:hypothetical protein [Psychrobacillus vulpis]TQR21678.1 hypothetical protein FG384_01605 [Psychrobacillus vulpis]
MESIHSFDSAIENFGDNQKKEAQASIQRYQSDKRSELEQTVSDLQNNSFDNYVENVKLDGEIDSEIHNILTEVFSH